MLSLVATLDYSTRKEFDSSQQKLENFAFISNYHVSDTMLSTGLKKKKERKKRPSPGPMQHRLHLPVATQMLLQTERLLPW